MRRILITSVLIATMLVFGCSNMNTREQRMLSGGAIGAGAGAVGSAIVHGSVATGAALGAAAGAVGGLIYDEQQRR